MSRFLEDQVVERGYAVLKTGPVDVPTTAVAKALGEISSLPGVTDVQVLQPREKADAPPNIYSGAFGTGEFPLHTDLAHWFLPPRYLLLRCVVGAVNVATRLVDGQELVQALGADALFRTLLQPRRPVRGTRPILRILHRESQGRYRVRWDSLFVTPASTKSACVFADIHVWLTTAGEVRINLSDPGDGLVVDNWRMLHGRTAVPPESRDRRIDRIYLNSLNGSQ